jgi:hypothetical protein
MAFVLLQLGICFYLPLFVNVSFYNNLVILYLLIGRVSPADASLIVNQPMLPIFPGTWTRQQTSLPPFFGSYGTIFRYVSLCQ